MSPSIQFPRAQVSCVPSARPASFLRVTQILTPFTPVALNTDDWVTESSPKCSEYELREDAFHNHVNFMQKIPLFFFKQ